MEFGEVLAMVILFIGAPWAIFTGIAKVRASNHPSTQAGSALRMSELHRLIEQAVAGATAPLIARIETLEAIVTDEDAPSDSHGRAGRIDVELLGEGSEEAPDPVHETAGPRSVRS